MDTPEIFESDVRSGRSHSMPQMYAEKRDLATMLLEQLRNSNEGKDITTATCANIDNMLPLDRSLWNESYVMELVGSRGFDTSTIRYVKFLNEFGKMKIKFENHPSVLSFKLLFDQSSFDGITTCHVAIVDCCCASPRQIVPAERVLRGNCSRTGLVMPPPPSLDEILPDLKPVSNHPQVALDNTTIQSDQRQGSERVFVGGLAPETTDATLRQYFGKYGILVEAAVILDRRSKLSRGFGFIAFENGNVPADIFKDDHVIDGKVIGVRMYGTTNKPTKSTCI
jgi:hypothetical protein